MTREELQRLIDIIVQELTATTSRPAVRCQCHSVLHECCPDRLSGVIAAGATRVGVRATGGAPAGVGDCLRGRSLPLRVGAPGVKVTVATRLTLP